MTTLFDKSKIISILGIFKFVVRSIDYHKAFALNLILALVLFSCQPKEPPKEEGEEEPEELVDLTCRPDYFSMQPFPTSTNFPLSEATLNTMVENREGHAIRAHGWELFAGLMDTVKSKRDQEVWLWRTWPTASQAFDAEETDPIKTSGGTKRQEDSFLFAASQQQNSEKVNLTPPAYRVPSSVCSIIGKDSTIAAGCEVPENGCQFQNNGDILIAGVIYNKTAFDHIRNNEIYDWENLASLWTNTYKDTKWQDREIPTFPNTSFALKPMLWPVKQSGYTPLPIFPLDCYDGTMGCDSLNRKVTYSGFEVQRVWKNAVAISPDISKKGTTLDQISFLYDVYTDKTYQQQIGPVQYQNVEVHTLDEFYHWQVSKEEWKAMSAVDKAIISQSSYWAYGEDFQPGDYLVLVAMHVMTKELPTWTFQSFWWDNTTQAQGSKFASQRDTVTSPPMPTAYASYLMTSTYGMNAKRVNPAEWPVAFNPYIELAAAHPIQTNCRNCHQRAAFPNPSQKEALGASIENYATYLLPNAGDPNTLDTLNFENAVFDSLLLVDFLWSIGDRVNPPTKPTYNEK